jgi:hypothetical protein
LNKILEIDDDRDFIREVVEIKGRMLDKINNTALERDLPELMVCFLDRLLI